MQNKGITLSRHGLGMRTEVSVTGTGRLRKCKNTEFVWDLRRRRFVKVEESKSFPVKSFQCNSDLQSKAKSEKGFQR